MDFDYGLFVVGGYQFVDGGQFNVEFCCGGLNFCFCFWGYCQQQIVGGLWIVQQILLFCWYFVYEMVVVGKVVFGVVWYCVGGDIVFYFWQFWDIGIVQLCLYVGFVVYFVEVVEQVKVGDVGYCFYFVDGGKCGVGEVYLVYGFCC